MKGPFQTSEDGFSLPGVLLITGAALLAILLFSRSQVNLRLAGKSVDAINSYSGFIGGFTNFISSSVHQNMGPLCSGHAAPLNGLTFNDKNVNQVISIPLSMPAADSLKSRCKAPLFNTDGRMHFCLNFVPSDTIANDSFGGSEHNYAEILIRAVDKWQRPISCADYISASPGSAALQIFYRLYWVTKTQPGKLFQKYGHYHGIKE